jgi:hypothetical protein
MFVRRVESAFLIGVKLARRAGSERGWEKGDVKRRTTSGRPRLFRQTNVELDYYEAKARRREGAVVIRRIVQRERKPKGGGGEVCWTEQSASDLHGQPRAGDAHL